jgi:hypothetical protein
VDLPGKLKLRIFHIWEYPDEAIRKVSRQVAVTFVLNDAGELLIWPCLSVGLEDLDSRP